MKPQTIEDITALNALYRPMDGALTGKPQTGSEIEWEGVPSAFSREPFMLTMDTEKDKIQGLKEERCGPAAPPTRKGVAKKP